MKHIFLPDAEEELIEAAKYYESKAPGVGVAFIAEVHKAVTAIITTPLSGTVVHKTIRKKVLPRYPFSVLYAIEEDTIVIVSVAHQKRRPLYWYKRLEGRIQR